MDFRTHIAIPHASCELNQNGSFLLLGSCFSEHMAAKMQQSGLCAVENPFGVLYNPASIAQCLHLLLQEEMANVPTIEYRGVWHSFWHHSKFSAADKAVFEENIAQSIQAGKEALQRADTLIITFGTAWVYEREGQVVSNCHKLPEKEFVRKKLTVEAIVAEWRELLALPQLRDKRIIFTVSPIRHVRDGLHENQLSKATLLLAINQLQGVEYFPAYEIVLDELRDYRFYAEDMLHPSQVAIDYVWQRFAETYFSTPIREQLHLQQKVWKRTQHRQIIHEYETNSI